MGSLVAPRVGRIILDVILQYRALVAGARLSRTIGRYENTLGYDKVAPQVLDYLQESRPFP
jgi:hypothetical protein